MNDANALLTSESILEALKYVEKRLMKKWLPMLLGSAEFAELKGVAKVRLHHFPASQPRGNWTYECKRRQDISVQSASTTYA